VFLRVFQRVTADVPIELCCIKVAADLPLSLSRREERGISGKKKKGKKPGKLFVSVRSQGAESRRGHRLFLAGEHSAFFPRQLRGRGGMISLSRRAAPGRSIRRARVRIRARVANLCRPHVTSSGALRVTRRPSYMESRARDCKVQLEERTREITSGAYERAYLCRETNRCIVCSLAALLSRRSARARARAFIAGISEIIILMKLSYRFAREFNSIIPADSFPRSRSPPAVPASVPPPGRYFLSELAAIISPNAVLRKLSSRASAVRCHARLSCVDQRVCARGRSERRNISDIRNVAHTDDESA